MTLRARKPYTTRPTGYLRPKCTRVNSGETLGVHNSVNTLTKSYQRRGTANLGKQSIAFFLAFISTVPYAAPILAGA